MYKRVIIKLSGEGLANKGNNLAIDFEMVKIIAGQVKKIQDKGIQVGVVVGGGNFWRGASAEKNGIPRNRADYIGMLATIMNALALQSGFEKEGITTKVQSAVSVDSRVAENYIKEKAVSYLNHYIEDLSLAEAAEIVATTRSAIHDAISKGKKKLISINKKMNG